MGANSRPNNTANTPFEIAVITMSLTEISGCKQDNLYPGIRKCCTGYISATLDVSITLTYFSGVPVSNYGLILRGGGRYNQFKHLGGTTYTASINLGSISCRGGTLSSWVWIGSVPDNVLKNYGKRPPGKAVSEDIIIYYYFDVESCGTIKNETLFAETLITPEFGHMDWPLLEGGGSYPPYPINEVPE